MEFVKAKLGWFSQAAASFYHRLVDWFGDFLQQDIYLPWSYSREYRETLSRVFRLFLDLLAKDPNNQQLRYILDKLFPDKSESSKQKIVRFLDIMSSNLRKMGYSSAPYNEFLHSYLGLDANPIHKKGSNFLFMKRIYPHLELMRGERDVLLLPHFQQANGWIVSFHNNLWCAAMCYGVYWILQKGLVIRFVKARNQMEVFQDMEFYR